MTDATMRAQLQRHLTAPQAPQLMYLAVKLGIPDLLRDGARSAADLAQHTRTHPPSLHRVLRGMVVLGLLSEEPNAAFALTPLGALLQRDHPDSLYDDALITGELAPAWCGLLQTVQTGVPAFNAVFGDGLFSYVATYPPLEASFNRHMAGMTSVIANAVLATYDFADAPTIIDIGGGYGTLLLSILTRYPAARGVLFDLPSVVASTRERLVADPAGLRCTCVPGDFFATVPQGGDVYLLEVVIHDWDDAAARQILANCAQMMHHHSRLLLIERLLPERALHDPAAIHADLNMLVLTGGHERTLANYQQLVASAGLTVSRILPTPSPWWVIEAIRR
jgi:O-methyltransferase domain/Dimerisation domain